MTRILYWNINNFSLPKIWVAGPPALAAEATNRLNYILDIMTGPGGGPPPDIIIIVEVHGRIREVGLEGTVLRSSKPAGQGLLDLLDDIRHNATLGPHWCLVPPLNLGELGQREAVAVFYNSTTLQFTGPNVFCDAWPGTPGTIVGQAQPVNAATFAHRINYPFAWRGALPYLAHPPHPVPALRFNRTHAFPGFGVINECQLAGQWEYYDTTFLPRPIPSPSPPPYPPNRIKFPNEGCRGPFWTQFVEVAAPPRILNLFTVHTSPSSASGAVLQMERVAEMTAVGANEVNVVLGDFNVDSFGAGQGAYDWLAVTPGHIYTMELDPRVAPVGPLAAFDPDRKPYCMTHILPTPDAEPFNNSGGVTDPQHNVYPRYGYMGNAWPVIGNSGAIDNIFTAYGGGGPATNITVINTLTGTPYNLYPPYPAGVTAELTGGLPYASSLGRGLLHLPPNMLIATPPANAGGGGIDPLSAGAAVHATNFKNLNNFGLVRSVSDHLPLMIDI
jgi:hypothetical protein